MPLKHLKEGFCQDFPPHLLSSGIKIEPPTTTWNGKWGKHVSIHTTYLQPQATCGTSTPTIVNQSPADPKTLPTHGRNPPVDPTSQGFQHQPSPSPPTLPPFQVTPGDTNRPDLEDHVCVRSHRYK